MVCRLCGRGEHAEEACPYNPSVEVEAINSLQLKARAHPASKPFRDCRAQLRLALSQREEDPARVWLELVQVRESAGKLPDIAKDDPILSADIERFRAKLEAEIFGLTQEVGDEVLAPLYVWVDLIRRRNKLDREILIARQHVKEARAARRDPLRAPRSHDETAIQIETMVKRLTDFRALIPTAPTQEQRAVWTAGGWDARIDALPTDPEVVIARGAAARQVLATIPAGRPLAKSRWAGAIGEIAGGAAAVLLFVGGVALAVVSSAAFLAVALLGAIALAACVALSLLERRRVEQERQASVDLVWQHTFLTERVRVIELELGWMRALLDGFRARRNFDESRAEGKQIEELKQWRPDLRDFVVEVARIGEDPRAPIEGSLIPGAPTPSMAPPVVTSKG